MLDGDHLSYAGDGDYDQIWGYPDDRYATSSSNTTANTNDDARPLTIRSSGFPINTSAEYMSPVGSTDHTNTAASGGFYGQLYNWCTAMGGQPNACDTMSVLGFDTTTSICPTGWRLPTGGTGGEFQALNAAINGGATNTDAGLRTNFLAVYSGDYTTTMAKQGVHDVYWSSTGFQSSTAWSFHSYATYVNAGINSGFKYHGFAVRCVL